MNYDTIIHASCSMSCKVLYYASPCHPCSECRKVYSLGRVPFFRFRVLGWRWMCQFSRRHRVVTKGLLSMTLALDRLTWWPVDHTCTAKADAAISPFWSARWCSLRWCFRVLPDCPMYTLGHSEQGIWYTMSLRWSMSTGSLGWTSWCLRVLCGRKATLMSRGPRILLTVSDRPLMYGGGGSDWSLEALNKELWLSFIPLPYISGL